MVAVPVFDEAPGLGDMVVLGTVLGLGTVVVLGVGDGTASAIAAPTPPPSAMVVAAAATITTRLIGFMPNLLLYSTVARSPGPPGVHLPGCSQLAV
jgi:hypothetical protein